MAGFLDEKGINGIQIVFGLMIFLFQWWFPVRIVAILHGVALVLKSEVGNLRKKIDAQKWDKGIDYGIY